MQARVPEVWLVAGDGRLRVGPAGVLLGRAPNCDIVLEDEAASRHHALVHRRGDGAVLVAMGRHGLTLNGEASDGGPLRDGDRIGLPGLEVAVAFELGALEGDPWLLAPSEGPAVRVARSPFVVGEGGDLALPGLPAGALSLLPGAARDRLRVTGGVPWQRNGVPIAPGVEVGAMPGDDLSVGAVHLVLERRGGEAATTRAVDRPPDRIELEFLPRGGRLHLSTAGQKQVLWLPERRFALLVCLLDPPHPHVAGDVVPDEVVLTRIWPRQPHKSRVDLNVLVGRLRKDLEEADLPPHRVVRAPGGGGTRFPLAQGAEVVVT